MLSKVFKFHKYITTFEWTLFKCYVLSIGVLRTLALRARFALHVLIHDGEAGVN